jgi:protein SCO1/2
MKQQVGNQHLTGQTISRFAAGVFLKACIIFLLFAFQTGSVSRAQPPVQPPPPASTTIGIDEHLDQHIPDDIFLTDENGQKVRMVDLIDKPTVINWVYYRCPGICSPLMEGLAKVMDQSDLVPGKDYQVLTISFDPQETIDLGIRKKTNYLNLVSKKDEIAKGWHFFVADSASIAQGTNATGFRYEKQGNNYVHAASICIVSPKGKITRYLNGITFLPFEFKMAIVESQKGLSAPTISKVLQYCFSYDPVGKTYVLNVTKITGTIILFLAGLMFLYLIFKPKRKEIN